MVGEQVIEGSGVGANFRAHGDSLRPGPSLALRVNSIVGLLHFVLRIGRVRDFEVVAEVQRCLAVLDLLHHTSIAICYLSSLSIPHPIN